MRKFKQVKRKEVVFDLTKWNEVEKRAAEVSLKTGTFIIKALSICFNLKLEIIKKQMKIAEE